MKRPAKNKGANNGKAKLTTDAVIHLRALCSMGWTYRRVGAKFGIGSSQVEKIFNRKAWAWLF